MSPDTSDATIKIGELIKSLDPDELGKFEPVSGLMLVNVSDAEFMAAFGRYAAHATSVDDIALIRTINHETYHAIQAGASGYYFDRARRLFQSLNSMQPPPDPGDDPGFSSMMANLRAEAGDDPDLKRRADAMEAVLLSNNWMAAADKAAAPGDNSMFGALHPEFFRYQDELAAHENAPNPDGLSIQGLLEGSAVVFTHLLMAPNEAQVRIENELAERPPVYGELYSLTLARAGPRTLEILLPATALALCYEKPNNAYFPMLSALASTAAGEALAYGRKVLANLPEIPDAGARLGTSIPLRRGDNSYRLYDAFIDNLEAAKWGVDAYAALAEPDAMNRVESFPFGIVTQDRPLAGQNSMTKDGLLARLAISSLVLRVRGRRRNELEMQDFMLQWAREVFDRLIDNLPPAPDKRNSSQNPLKSDASSGGS